MAARLLSLTLHLIATRGKGLVNELAHLQWMAGSLKRMGWFTNSKV